MLQVKGQQFCQRETAASKRAEAVSSSIKGGLGDAFWVMKEENAARAEFIHRIIKDSETPEKIEQEVAKFVEQSQSVKYCFE